MKSINSIKKPFNTKVWLISAIVGVAFVAAAFGGLVYASTEVTSQFNTQLGDVKSELRSAVADTSTKLAEANKNKKREEIVKILTDAAERIEAELDVVPEDVSVVGLQLVSQAARQTKQAIIDKARTLADRIKESADLITYQDKVFMVVISVKDLQGTNEAQLTAMAKQWLDILNQLKAMKPTAPATEIHEDLIEHTASVQSTLAVLPELFKKNDQMAFSAKQKELEGKIAGLHELAESLQAVNIAQDKALAEADQALKLLLQ